MKIVSEYKELEGKIFNSVEECAEEEAKVEEQRKALAEKEKDKSKLRKRLSTDVDKAEESLKLAYQNYDKVKEEARAIIEAANKEAGELLKAAKDEINTAEKLRTEAILKYNAECGPYQKIYTGDKAKEEYARLSRYMDSMFNDIWRVFRF